MKVRLIAVPYDSGHREWRMGRGPAHLVRHGLASSIRALGHDVSAEFVESDEHTPIEPASSFALYRLVAERVRAARGDGFLPVVLAGNCGATIGVVAAVDGDPAVLWLDAHGDFNTPETSPSGYLDGMSVAVLTGRCWGAMAATIPGFAPLPEENVVLVGVRSLDQEEERALADSEVRVVRAEELRVVGVARALGPVLDELRQRSSRLHLHVDLDVADVSAVGRANQFASNGGITAAQLALTIRAAAERFTITSATFSAFDPEYDLHGGIFRLAVQALETLVGAAITAA